MQIKCKSCLAERAASSSIPCTRMSALAKTLVVLMAMAAVADLAAAASENTNQRSVGVHYSGWSATNPLTNALAPSRPRACIRPSDRDVTPAMTTAPQVVRSVQAAVNNLKKK